MKKYLFFLSLLPLFCTCQTAKKAALEAQNKPLIETHWAVNTILGEPLSEETPNQAFIVFDTTGNYHGDLGCNKFFGSYYEKRKQKLELTYSGSTKRLCHDMDTEDRLLKTLRLEKLSYHIKKDTLLLYSNNKEIIRFIAAKPETNTNN